MPKLSICVPSRNRQFYFQQTISAMLESQRTDVEFVFADNSDDASIINDYMASISDPRVVFLPSTDKPLSMVDNWERMVAASSGEWVTVVGDDDYADPEIAGFLTRLQEFRPDVDGITWSILHYYWPSDERPTNVACVDFRDNVLSAPRDLLIARMFGWEDAGLVPTSGMSIYHSAMHRRLLDKIKATYGRQFEHPIVDYDSAIKNMIHGKTFFVVARPMTVMGSCPASNSYSIGRLEDMKKMVRLFNEDSGRDIDLDPEAAAFPFKFATGLTATIGQVLHWYRTKYKFSHGGWEKNFVEACQRNVESFRDREAFDLVKESYQRAVDSWQGGRFSKYFKPQYNDGSKGVSMTGFSDTAIYMDYDVPGMETAAGFYRLAGDLILPVDAIPIRASGMGELISTKSLKKKS